MFYGMVNSITAQLPRVGEAPRWYAFRTMFKREKLVARRLTAHGLECYLPLRKVIRRYKSKTTTVDLPLISSYVFVRLMAKQYSTALADEDVFEIVSFNGEAGRVTEQEVSFLKRVLSDTEEGYDPEVGESLAVGSPIVLAGGSLAGTRGVIVETRGKHNFMVRLEALGLSVSLTVSREVLAASSLINPGSCKIG